MELPVVLAALLPVMSTHNGGHTTTYYQYVYDKLKVTYDIYGPDGADLAQSQ